MTDLIHKYSLQHLHELTKKPTPIVEQESEKSHSDILKIKKEQAEKQKIPKYTIKSTDKATLEEYDLKSALYQSMHTNKRRTKESESIKKPSTTKETPKDKAPTKGSKTSKSASAKEPVEEPNAEVIMEDAGNDVVHDDDQPQAASEPKTYKTQNPEWTCLESNNPEGYRYPFNLSKPLPLYGPLGHHAIAVDYFFNNDLEYLKTFDPEVTYTLSITKTKAARYEIKGIDDMVPTLWGTINHASDIVYFIVALRMFIRSLILKGRVEDLQLGVERYQKNLNITKSQKTFPGIEFKEPYTPSYDPP
ncbi:hypothetical protein Tco_0156203 [Tanacetum coccineum]